MVDLGKYLPFAFKLMAHRDELERLWAISAPIFADIKRAYPEAYSIAHNVCTDLFPQLEETFSGKGVAATFDVRWLQESLNKLLGIAIPVTGSYDDVTHAAVSTFQQAHPECGGVDGWAGIKTVMVIGAALLARK